MADQEKFSLLKFLGSFVQWLPWVKTARYAIGIAAIGLIGLTIYKAFFMPTQTTKQETHIIAQPGSQVTIDQKREEKNDVIERLGRDENEATQGRSGDSVNSPGSPCD